MEKAFGDSSKEQINTGPRTAQMMAFYFAALIKSAPLIAKNKNREQLGSLAQRGRRGWKPGLDSSSALP